MARTTAPEPLFDTLKHIDAASGIPKSVDTAHGLDYEKALAFLKCYTGSQGTFNSYRREVERLLHWTWLVAKKSIRELKREDIEAFILFCKRPNKTWIGVKKAPRFLEKDGERFPNKEWRPFVVTVSKAAREKGKQPDKKDFQLSQGAVKELFAILSSFYNYLLQEEYLYMNPVALIRQKSKFIQKEQSLPKIRRLSELQWSYVIETAKLMAEKSPDQHERTLFIMSALYSMYLRISELAASERWTPEMSDFHRDQEESWWFVTVGKGNKKRQIAVSDSMLGALRRWRQHLNLSPLPSAADNSPLLPKTKGKGPISSTTYIREIVQKCFDESKERLRDDGFIEDAEALSEVTVHWLRHTGISDDVKHRPREHVRDDAGHGSSAITDKYIDIELRERHASAKRKLIN